jgi:hypothetical protein
MEVGILGAIGTGNNRAAGTGNIRGDWNW